MATYRHDAEGAWFAAVRGGVILLVPAVAALPSGPLARIVRGRSHLAGARPAHCAGRGRDAVVRAGGARSRWWQRTRRRARSDHRAGRRPRGARCRRLHLGRARRRRCGRGAGGGRRRRRDGRRGTAGHRGRRRGRRSRVSGCRGGCGHGGTRPADGRSLVGAAPATTPVFPAAAPAVRAPSAPPRPPAPVVAAPVTAPTRAALEQTMVPAEETVASVAAPARPSAPIAPVPPAPPPSPGRRRRSRRHDGCEHRHPAAPRSARNAHGARDAGQRLARWIRSRSASACPTARWSRSARKSCSDARRA